MSKPFDATMKDILALAPEAWPRLLGYPAPKAEVISADIATVSGAADHVIRVKGKPD
jgi:hypothetical protein